jgi:hypothetical protein
LRLSRILDWYADDFGGRRQLPAYLSHYVPGHPDLSGYAVSFLDYDWRLNLAPPAQGEWVALAQAQPVRAEPEGERSGGLAAGQVFEVVERRGGWLRLALPFDRGTGWVEAAATRPFRVPR